MKRRKKPDPTEAMDFVPVQIWVSPDEDHLCDLVEADPDAVFAEGMDVKTALDILQAALDDNLMTQRDRNAILRLAERYV